MDHEAGSDCPEGVTHSTGDRVMLALGFDCADVHRTPNRNKLYVLIVIVSVLAAFSITAAGISLIGQ